MDTGSHRFIPGMVLAFVFAAPLHAGGGDMDTSFGEGGLLRYPEGFDALASLPDGRLQFVAVTGGELRVLRLANGRPDPAFGTAGVLTAAIPGALPPPFTAYVQTDGSTFLVPRGGGTSVTLMKIDPSGRPDTNFGPNGIREIPRSTAFANDLVYIDGISVGPGGAVNVLLKYFADAYECADALIVYRLRTNGEPDVTFGAGGSQALQLSGACYWWGQTPIVALAGDRLLLDENGTVLDGHGGKVALPAPLQATLENRRLLRIEDAGEYLYLIATTRAPTKPGLELNISRWRRDLTLDNTFGKSGTGYLDISLDDIPLIPFGELVAVRLLPASSNTQQMYLQVTAYGHSAGQEGAREYAARVYRLRADGMRDRAIDTYGPPSGNSLLGQLVQQSSDGNFIAQVGQRIVVRVGESVIESPGVIISRFSCGAANGVAEGAGAATVAFARILGSKGAASLNLQTQALSAKPGVDYTEVQETLNWMDGEAGQKSISVPIIDNSIFGPDVQFLLRAEPVPGTASALDCSSGLFQIISNDIGSTGPPPGVVVPTTSANPPSSAPTQGGGMFDYKLTALLVTLLLVRTGPRRWRQSAARFRLTVMPTRLPSA